MRKLLFSPLICLTYGSAAAIPITFELESDFLAAVEPTHIESFENEPAVFDVTTVSTSLFTVETEPQDGGTARLIVDKTGGSPTTLHATDGLSFMHAGSVTNDSWLLTFTLNFAVDAIAFQMTDPLERRTPFGGQSQLLLTTGAGDTAVIGTCPPCLPTGSELFFGFYSPDAPFTTFTILNTAFSDGIGFDKFQFVSVSVPEPATLLIFTLGLLGLPLLSSAS